jgi:hypothetical protein
MSLFNRLASNYSQVIEDDSKDDLDVLRIVARDRRMQLSSEAGRRDSTVEQTLPPILRREGEVLSPVEIAGFLRLLAYGDDVRQDRSDVSVDAATLRDALDTGGIRLRFLQVRLMQQTRDLNALAATVGTYSDQLRDTHALGLSKYRSRVRSKLSKVYSSEVVGSVDLFNATVSGVWSTLLCMHLGFKLRLPSGMYVCAGGTLSPFRSSQC